MLLFFLLSLAFTYTYGSEANKADLSKEEIEKKALYPFPLDQISIQDTVEPQSKKEDSEKSPKQEEIVRTSLPKYTIMQIKEMKAKGIDPDVFEEEAKPKLADKNEGNKAPEKSDKPIYYSPVSACAHLRFGQVCEYRLPAYGRWIGNCAKKGNGKGLYCK